jgi:hypothetical protein
VIVERFDDGTHRIIFGDGRLIEFGSPEDLPDALLALVRSGQIPPDMFQLRLAGFTEDEAEGLIHTCEVRVGEELPHAIIEAVSPSLGLARVRVEAALETRYDFTKKSVQVVERPDLPDGRKQVDVVVRAPAEVGGGREVVVTASVIGERDTPPGLIQKVVDWIQALLDRLLRGGLRAGDLKARVQRELNALSHTDPDFRRVRVRVRVNAADIIILQKDRTHGATKRQPS